MVSVHFTGETDQSLWENFNIIRYKEEVSIHGMMVENMKVNGKTIKCMVKVHLHG